MKINILTLFPEMFDIFKHSIIGRARENGFLHIETVNIRDYTLNKHKKVDDYPYGGGAGMVMTPQPVVDAIKAVKEKNNMINPSDIGDYSKKMFEQILNNR